MALDGWMGRVGKPWRRGLELLEQLESKRGAGKGRSCAKEDALPPLAGHRGLFLVSSACFLLRPLTFFEL